MQKLNLKDIKLRSAGYYVKNEILQKYDSIEAFADSINIYKDSVCKYLDSSKLGSATFKLKLVQCLDKGLNDIIITKESQIRNWVNDITNNICLYRSKDDIELLQKVKGLCIKYELQVETAKTLRAISTNNFYNNNSSTAIELLKLSIEILDNENENKLVFEYTSELALVYFYENDFKKANEIMRNIRYLISIYEFNNEVLHLYYYRLGQILRLLNKNKDAQEMFIKAFEYGYDNYYKGKALMNIGITLKNQKCYVKALEIYLDTYYYFEKNDTLSISILENNIAELYKEIHNYDKAIKYINKAIIRLGDTNIQKKFIYTQTYVQVKILQGEPKEAIHELISLIKRCNDRFLYKNHIIECMKILIKYSIKTKNIDIISNLEDRLLYLIKNEKKENRYIIELKALLCDIFLYNKGKGGLI